MSSGRVKAGVGRWALGFRLWARNIGRGRHHAAQGRGAVVGCLCLWINRSIEFFRNSYKSFSAAEANGRRALGTFPSFSVSSAISVLIRIQAFFFVLSVSFVVQIILSTAAAEITEKTIAEICSFQIAGLLLYSLPATGYCLPPSIRNHRLIYGDHGRLASYMHSGNTIWKRDVFYSIRYGLITRSRDLGFRGCCIVNYLVQ